MQTRLTNLFARMEEYRKAGKVFPAGLAYQALTCDVITCYSFGTSTDYINLPDWNAPYFEAVQKNFEMSHTFKHVRFLGPLMSSLPVPVTKFLMPALKSLFDLQGVCCLKHVHKPGLMEPPGMGTTNRRNAPRGSRKIQHRCRLPRTPVR